MVVTAVVYCVNLGEHCRIIVHVRVALYTLWWLSSTTLTIRSRITENKEGDKLRESAGRNPPPASSAPVGVWWSLCLSLEAEALLYITDWDFWSKKQSLATLQLGGKLTWLTDSIEIQTAILKPSNLKKVYSAPVRMMLHANLHHDSPNAATTGK